MISLVHLRENTTVFFVEDQIMKETASADRKTRGQGVKLPPEVQAQIFAALLMGQFTTDAELADAKGVSKQTVSRLRKYIPEEFAKFGLDLKQKRITDLVLSYLEEGLESSMRIDSVTNDIEWLKSQDAASLATLYGVKSDKIFKLLEAIELAEERRQERSGAAE